VTTVQKPKIQNTALQIIKTAEIRLGFNNLFMHTMETVNNLFRQAYHRCDPAAPAILTTAPRPRLKSRTVLRNVLYYATRKENKPVFCEALLCITFSRQKSACKHSKGPFLQNEVPQLISCLHLTTQVLFRKRVLRFVFKSAVKSPSGYLQYSENV
jgi:hypothetical protein